MESSKRNKIEVAKRIKKYHCLKLVEGLVKGDEKVADKHLRKLIETRLGNKLKHVVNREKFI